MCTLCRWRIRLVYDWRWVCLFSPMCEINMRVEKVIEVLLRDIWTCVMVSTCHLDASCLKLTG